MSNLDAETYLAHIHASRRRAGPLGPPLSLEDLRWPGEPYDIPSFGLRHAGPGYVTGTPPFMSCWLDNDEGHPHTAIHDAELFLWAFVKTSLDFEGPGATRSQRSPEFDRFFTALFLDPYTSRKTKRQILQSQEELDGLLSHVSPYFVDFKDLTRDWRRVLEIAHKYPAGMEYNYPHQAIVRCIDRAISKVRASPAPESTMEKDAKQKRIKSSDEIKQAILNQQTVHAMMNDQTKSTATSPTVPDQDIPSSNSATRASNRLPPSQTRQKSKGRK